MKPIVIILSEKDGKTTINIEEFKKYMEEVYNQGFNDGRSSATTITTTSSWNYAPAIYSTDARGAIPLDSSIGINNADAVAISSTPTIEDTLTPHKFLRREDIKTGTII